MKWTITESSARELKLERGKNDLIRFDDKIAGFGVRVRRLDSGEIARSYVYQYKVGDRQYRASLGKVDGITAKQARTLAQDHTTKLRSGIIPAEEQRAMRARSSAPTLNEAVEQYLAAMATIAGQIPCLVCAFI
jgi:hypothetical protein